MEKKLQQIEMAAKDLIKYYCPEYKMLWSNSQNFKGYCKTGLKTIGISRAFAEVNTFESMLLTVIHEISHALTYGQERRHHGKLWKTKCIELGGDGLIYWTRSGETVDPRKRSFDK